MKRHRAQGVIVLLIVGCLGASLLMVASVEDADAWPYHPCCDTKVIIIMDQNGLSVEIEAKDCDHTFHWHALSCGFVCPSS